MTTCVKCGQRKPAHAFSPDPKRRTPKGHKRRRPYCKTCDAQRARDYRAQRPTCPGCGKQRPARTGFYYWRDKRYPDLTRRSRVCRECHRTRTRERYAGIMADPYTAKRERNRRAQRPDVAGVENADRCRRYRARLKTQRPDEYQRQLEDARIRNKLTKMRTGKIVNPPAQWVGRGRTVYLDPAPILKLAATIHPDAKSTLAREIHRLTHESKRVELSVVDAITLAAGLFPQDVYPELVA